VTVEMTAVRVGLVGAGYIAGVHSAAYRAIPGTFAQAPAIELAAVADVDRDRAQALARGWGWAAATDDWRELTRRDDIDLIDVSVPNALHVEIAIDALAHGKHVVCEKPLAADVAGATQMVEAADAAGTIADVCFYYRTWPAIQWARTLIDAGEIGTVTHARGWMLQDYARVAGESLGWRTDRAQAGAGALGDLGSHIFDLLRYLAGEVTNVCAVTRSTIERPAGAEADDMAAILLEFASGASGVLETGWAMAGHRCDLGFDIVGSRGALRFSWERSNQIEVCRDANLGGGFETVLVGPEMAGVGALVGVPGQGLGYRDAFGLGLLATIEGIGGDAGTVAPTFADGLEACRFVAAAQRSSAERRWVELSGASVLVGGTR
jgi:predicted dehydrogenase